MSDWPWIVRVDQDGTEQERYTVRGFDSEEPAYAVAARLGFSRDEVFRRLRSKHEMTVLELPDGREVVSEPSD